jgi:hypothetical protein
MELAFNATSSACGASAGAYTGQCAPLKSGPLHVWPRSDRLNAHLLAAAKHVKLVRDETPAQTGTCGERRGRRGSRAVKPRTEQITGLPRHALAILPPRAGPHLFQTLFKFAQRERSLELGGALACRSQAVSALTNCILEICH